MATRKQRELLRRRRIEFDRRVAENRKNGALDDMTRQQLIAFAYENEINIDVRAKKSEILAEIKKVMQ